jgi:hypothetical protein
MELETTIFGIVDFVYFFLTVIWWGGTESYHGVGIQVSKFDPLQRRIIL